MPVTCPHRPSIWGRTVTTRLLAVTVVPLLEFAPRQSLDRRANFLVPGRRFRRCRDDLKLRGRIHAQKLVLALPNANREQAALDTASERLLIEHLRQPIELTQIALDHPQPRHSINRPQPLQRTIQLSGAEPKLLPNRSQRSASRQRLGNRVIALFLPDCCPDRGIGHV